MTQNNCSPFGKETQFSSENYIWYQEYRRQALKLPRESKPLKKKKKRSFHSK